MAKVYEITITVGNQNNYFFVIAENMGELTFSMEDAAKALGGRVTLIKESPRQVYRYPYDLRNSIQKSLKEQTEEATANASEVPE